jgi:hypothetical protein
MAEGGGARKGHPASHGWRNAPRRRDLAVAREHFGLVRPVVHRQCAAGLDPGDIDIEVFQAKLQLIVLEAFRPAAVPATLQHLHDLP